MPRESSCWRYVQDAENSIRIEDENGGYIAGHLSDDETSRIYSTEVGAAHRDLGARLARLPLLEALARRVQKVGVPGSPSDTREEKELRAQATDALTRKTEAP